MLDLKAFLAGPVPRDPVHARPIAWQLLKLHLAVVVVVALLVVGVAAAQAACGEAPTASVMLTVLLGLPTWAWVLRSRRAILKVLIHGAFTPGTVSRSEIRTFRGATFNALVVEFQAAGVQHVAEVGVPPFQGRPVHSVGDAVEILHGTSGTVMMRSDRIGLALGRATSTAHRASRPVRIAIGVVVGGLLFAAMLFWA